MRSLRIAKYLLAALVASAATAHDVWFEPTTFFPAVDERVGGRQGVARANVLTNLTQKRELELPWEW